MKTIGERMRQARNYRGMSGETLAEKVGYKNQSAIGNLENRSTGSGGNKIVEIAAALNVPLSWLMSGPDVDDLSTIDLLPPGGKSNAINEAGGTYTIDPRKKLAAIIDRLPAAALDELLRFAEYLQSRQAPPTQPGAGDHVPAHKRAA